MKVRQYGKEGTILSCLALLHEITLPSIVTASLYQDYFAIIVVRTKVKEILELLTDDERLRDERKKSRKLKDKYVGVSGGGMGECCNAPLIHMFIDMQLLVR